MAIPRVGLQAIADPALRALAAAAFEPSKLLVVDFRQQWAEGTHRQIRNLITGEVATRRGAAGVDKHGLILDGASAVYWPGVFGIGAQSTNNSAYIVGVSLNNTSQAGAFIKVGNADGYGFGVGNTDLDTAGNQIIGIRESINWMVTGDNFGTGFHVVSCESSINFDAKEMYLDAVNIYSEASKGHNAPTGGTWIGSGQDVRWMDEGRIAFVLLGVTIVQTGVVAITAKYADLIRALGVPGTPYAPTIVLPGMGLDFAPAAGGTTDLVIADAAQAHAADNLALTQTHVLTVANAAQAHTADNLALTQTHVLALADAAHGHTADEFALTQAHVLTVADATHGHAAEAPTLTQLHILAVDEALHAHAADSLVLAAQGDLVVQDAAHAQAVDNLALTQVHVLIVADAAHGQAADELTLAGGVSLVIDDALQAQAAEALGLTQVHVLAVADALHAVAVDALTLTQVHYLVIGDAAHGQSADNVVLSLLTAVTPGTRVVIVPAELRALAVPAEIRAIRVYH